MPNDEAAVQLLYDNIHSLPGEDGPINMLPFAHDSEQVRSVKRMVCEAIVNLLDSGGHLRRDVAPVEPLASRDAVVQCKCCGKELVCITTNANGVGTVDAGLFISGIAGVNVECPHSTTTLDDMRLHMQREFDLAEAEGAEE